LIGAHSSCDNLRLVVILSAHRQACQAAQHRDLADVREGIGYRALEKLLRGLVQRIAGGQIGIECFNDRKEALDFRVPRKSG
jgi:hypothetical protein